MEIKLTACPKKGTDLWDQVARVLVPRPDSSFLLRGPSGILFVVDRSLKPQEGCCAIVIRSGKFSVEVLKNAEEANVWGIVSWILRPFP